jgi:hypothetical protein
VAGFFSLAQRVVATHHRGMTTDASLFPSLLGDAWPQLAAPVRRLHGGSSSITMRGSADVEGASRLPARILRYLLGLPGPGPTQAVEVRIERHGMREVWTRRFATGLMRSVLSPGPGRTLHEQLGPATLRFRLHRNGDAIEWQLIGASVLGLPLPRKWLGSVSARSGAADGRYPFSITARLPLFGQWIAYRGSLEMA